MSPPAPPPRPGSGGLVLAFTGYLTAVFVSGLIGSMAAGLTSDSEGVVAMLAGQVGFWAVLVGTVGVARRRTHPDRGSERPLRFRWVDVPVGALVGIATQLVLVPAVYLPLRGLVDEAQLSGPAEDLFDRVNGAGVVALAIAVVVIAPVVEELFFRGLLLGAMQRRWGVAAAVTGSAIVFGATHFQPLQFPGLALAGAVFAAAAVRTGRLGTAVAVHAAFNATTFTALVLLA